jgi:hypothetical protein
MAARQASGDMSSLFWLTDEQMARLEPFFPKSHGKPRVDDRRMSELYLAQITPIGAEIDTLDRRVAATAKASDDTRRL